MSAISRAEQARRGHAVGVVCDAAAGDPLTEARLARAGAAPGARPVPHAA